jgi:anti-sigma factor RsiW
MNCADLEILLADYVDGTLRGEEKSAVESHIASCEGCAELARDAAGAVNFMQRASQVDAPPELVTRILFEITNGPSRAAVKPSWVRRYFGKWLEPILQPRFAMGMAMTVLSFAMLGRFSGMNVRQLKPSDLDPVKVWMATEDRVQRTWERTVKYYESLRLVYAIQTQLKEWTDEQQGDSKPASPVSSPARSGTERK